MDKKRNREWEFYTNKIVLYVEAYAKRNEIPETALIIDTTSRAGSGSWTQGLSPFILPGGHLYGNYYAKNVENAWQAAKVYKEFVDENENPSSKYFEWAEKIWNDNHAHRYPMGRNAKPLYSYWNGEKLSYIDARIKIYIPIYKRAVLQSNAYKTLLEIYKIEKRDIYLIDFDGYNHIKQGKTLIDVVTNPNKKMGHAFVIYGLLTYNDRIKKLF